MPKSSQDDEIMAFLRSEQDSYYRGDFDAFVAHWHHGPEVRRILSGPHEGTRVHIGWEDLKAKFEEGFRQFPQNFDASKLLRWDNVQIQSTDDMAWITYEQIVVGTRPPGMHVSPMSHEVKVIQKIDGAWKLICLVVVAPGLGRADVPQIEMDQDGKVADMNALAKERLPGHSGLTVSNGRPRAQNRAFDAGLQAAIRKGQAHLSTNLPRGFMDRPDSIVPLGDDPDGMPLFCWIHCEQERVILSFDNRAKLRERLVEGAATFGLSKAQMRVADLISAGHDLAGVAAELGVSVNTVRTHLRRMFDKTQTHNQATLIARLLNAQRPD